MVTVGFTISVTGVASSEGVRQSICESVPAVTESLNLAASEKGLEYGMSKLFVPHAP